MDQRSRGMCLPGCKRPSYFAPQFRVADPSSIVSFQEISVGVSKDLTCTHLSEESEDTNYYKETNPVPTRWDDEWFTCYQHTRGFYIIIKVRWHWATDVTHPTDATTEHSKENDDIECIAWARFPMARMVVSWFEHKLRVNTWGSTTYTLQ